jgi:hypothetical protein
MANPRLPIAASKTYSEPSTCAVFAGDLSGEEVAVASVRSAEARARLSLQRELWQSLRAMREASWQRKMILLGHRGEGEP